MNATKQPDAIAWAGHMIFVDQNIDWQGAFCCVWDPKQTPNIKEFNFYDTCTYA